MSRRVLRLSMTPPLPFALEMGTGRHETQAPRRLRRLAHVRPLRRLGLQPGRGEERARRGRAGRPDGRPGGHRRRLRDRLRVRRQEANLRPRRDSRRRPSRRRAVHRGIRRALQIAALDDGVAGDRVHLRRAVLRRPRRGVSAEGRALAARAMGGAGAGFRRGRARHDRSNPGRRPRRRRAGVAGGGAVGRHDARDQGDAAQARRPGQGAVLPDRGRGASCAPDRLRPRRAAAGHVSSTTIALLLWQGVAVVGVSYSLWFWVLKRYAAPQLSAFTFVSPLVGVFAGWLVFGDRITPAFSAAIALVLAGLALVNWPRPRTRKTE